MNDFIKQVKQTALSQMKNQYQNLQNSQAAAVEAKFNEKKADLDLQSRQLDEALSKFISEIQTDLNSRIEKEREKVNIEIAEKRQEVADKKAKNAEDARTAAEKEVSEITYKETAELLKEIEKLEKELA